MYEGRCPYCNGTGSLPAETVARFECQRDEYVRRLDMIGRLWAALADLSCEASPTTKKRREAQTLDTLRAAIRRAYVRFHGIPLEYIAGRERHE